MASRLELNLPKNRTSQARFLAKSLLIRFLELPQARVHGRVGRRALFDGRENLTRFLSVARADQYYGVQLNAGPPLLGQGGALTLQPTLQPSGALPLTR